MNQPVEQATLSLLMQSELELFKEACELLYGRAWKTQASMLFNVDVRTIANWYSQHTPIPSYVWDMLERQLKARQLEVAQCTPKVEKQLRRTLEREASGSGGKR